MQLLARVLPFALASLSFGCAASRATARPVSPAVRVLETETPRITREASDASCGSGDVIPEPSEQETMPAPRIGAPGGSGSGSRRVLPAQSGNDTVGGLPAGMGGGSGPAGGFG